MSTPTDLPLHARLKAATAWRPASGDMVAGHLVTVEGRTTEFGTYPMLIIEAEDGTLVAVHAFHSVLKTELQRVKPIPGGYLEIAYLGTTPSRKRTDASGKPVNTHVYSVSDGSAKESFNSWDDFMSDEDVDF